MASRTELVNDSLSSPPPPLRKKKVVTTRVDDWDLDEGGGGSKKKKEKPHHEAWKPFLNRLKSWLRDRPFGFFYMASWKRFTEARQARLNKKTVRQPTASL